MNKMKQYEFRIICGWDKPLVRNLTFDMVSKDDFTECKNEIKGYDVTLCKKFSSDQEAQNKKNELLESYGYVKTIDIVNNNQSEDDE